MSGFRLGDEAVLIQAELVLHEWAAQLADNERDYNAADAIRTASAILKFRCGLPESIKGKSTNDEVK